MLPRWYSRRTHIRIITESYALPSESGVKTRLQSTPWGKTSSPWRHASSLDPGWHLGMWLWSSGTPSAQEELRRNGHSVNFKVFTSKSQAPCVFFSRNHPDLSSAVMMSASARPVDPTKEICTASSFWYGFTIQQIKPLASSSWCLRIEL